MSKTAISNIGVGTTIQIKMNGEWKDFIVGKHDEYGTPVFEKVVSVQKRMHSENVSDYEGCEVDVWLQDENEGYLSYFDEATRVCFVNRNISTFNYGDTEATYISRKIYIPSRGDVDAIDPTATEPDASNGILRALMNASPNTQNTNSTRIAYNSSNSAVYWWLRSPSVASNFYFVNSVGYISSYGASNTGNWLRPLINVANATLIATEGGVLRLDPQGQDYYEVEFEQKVGESMIRPKSCAVQYNAVNLTDVEVQVCNNYGDENPVWEDATTQEEIEFTNTSKQTTNWQIGIKCYGKSDYNGGFNEPVVKILTD